MASSHGTAIWRSPLAMVAVAGAVVAMVGAPLGAATTVAVRLVTLTQQTPQPPAGQGAGAPAAIPAVSCAQSWGQAGALAAAYSTPMVPRGVDACGAGTLRPSPTPSGCTRVVAADGLQAVVDAANPGDRICAQGTTSQRLTVRRSGTAGAPIQIIGVGQTSVRGVTVAASHVVVAGLNAALPVAPGIEITGDNITLLNNTVTSPRGGDGDGIRFFGTNLNILHNTVRDVRNLGGAHADCMQTFATSTPASLHVLIASNRCEKIDNQCLIAEGPHSSAGDGSGKGQSSNIEFVNNYCDTDASQALMIDDVQNMAVAGNDIASGNQKAFAFANNSTGAAVGANLVAKNIGYQVGMDSSSKSGYQGPPVGGKP